MKILLVDNYDSFTYNLAHIIEQYCDLDVIRNDKISINDIDKYDKIIISPGPGLPSDSPILNQIITKFYKSKSILGICLGHQAIAESFGSKLINLDEVYHGVAIETKITDSNSIIYNNIPNNFKSGRYHSWVVLDETLSNELKITATDKNDNIMSLQHKEYDVCGIQYHPESILTPEGEAILRNWIQN